MHVMLLASARYNTELDRYVDDGDDDVNRQGSLFEESAKPRKQIGSRYLAERVTIISPGLGA